jgi:hypothetical protein
MNHPSLLLWLVAQPEEIQGLIHALAKSNSIILVWDEWRQQPLAVLPDHTVRRVIAALALTDLAVAVRVPVTA